MTVYDGFAAFKKCQQVQAATALDELAKKHMTVYDGLFNITKIKNFSYSVIPKKAS